MLTRMARLSTRMARMARLLTRMARMLTRMTRWLAGSHIIHTLFVSESMQTLFLFNMRRKGKWKMPKVDLKWISSFLLPQYNLVYQKIMFTLG